TAPRPVTTTRRPSGVLGGRSDKDHSRKTLRAQGFSDYPRYQRQRWSVEPAAVLRLECLDELRERPPSVVLPLRTAAHRAAGRGRSPTHAVSTRPAAHRGQWRPVCVVDLCFELDRHIPPARDMPQMAVGIYRTATGSGSPSEGI